jgi:hypothetical protein
MHQVKRRAQVGYEDLMRELEVFEQMLMQDNRPVGMDFMVLEAKIRDRFESMGKNSWEKLSLWELTEPGDNDLTIEQIQALIPRDIGSLPSVRAIEQSRLKKRVIETIGMAALLAGITSLGVLGLASVLKFVLGWIA